MSGAAYFIICLIHLRVRLVVIANLRAGRSPPKYVLDWERANLEYIHFFRDKSRLYPGTRCT